MIEVERLMSWNDEDFVHDKILQKAIHGKVTLRRHKQSNTFVAVKSVPLESLLGYSSALENLANEVEHGLLFSQAPFCLGLYGVFSDGKQAHIVSEYAAQGDMFANLNRYEYDDIRRIVAQLLCSLEQIHMRGYAHRDISLENIFILEDGSIRLADFAQSVKWGMPSCGNMTCFPPSSEVGSTIPGSLCAWTALPTTSHNAEKSNQMTNFTGITSVSDSGIFPLNGAGTTTNGVPNGSMPSSFGSVGNTLTNSFSNNANHSNMNNNINSTSPHHQTLSSPSPSPNGRSFHNFSNSNANDSHFHGNMYNHKQSNISSSSQQNTSNANNMNNNSGANNATTPSVSGRRPLHNSSSSHHHLHQQHAPPPSSAQNHHNNHHNNTNQFSDSPSPTPTSNFVYNVNNSSTYKNNNGLINDWSPAPLDRRVSIVSRASTSNTAALPSIIHKPIAGQCGKNYYRAPEVYSLQQYDPRAVDVFAAGVLLFLLLVSIPPWDSAEEKDARFLRVKEYGVTYLIQRWRDTFPDKPQFNVPPEAIDLLEWMLKVDPAKRPSARQCRFHPFFSVPTDTSVKSRLLRYPPEKYKRPCADVAEAERRYKMTPLQLSCIWEPHTLPFLKEITNGQCFDPTFYSGRPIRPGAAHPLLRPLTDQEYIQQVYQLSMSGGSCSCANPFKFANPSQQQNGVFSNFNSSLYNNQNASGAAYTPNHLSPSSVYQHEPSGYPYGSGMYTSIIKTVHSEHRKPQRHLAKTSSTQQVQQQLPQQHVNNNTLISFNSPNNKDLLNGDDLAHRNTENTNSSTAQPSSSLVPPTSSSTKTDASCVSLSKPFFPPVRSVEVDPSLNNAAGNRKGALSMSSSTLTAQAAATDTIKVPPQQQTQQQNTNTFPNSVAMLNNTATEISSLNGARTTTVNGMTIGSHFLSTQPSTLSALSSTVVLPAVPTHHSILVAHQRQTDDETSSSSCVKPSSVRHIHSTNSVLASSSHSPSKLSNNNNSDRAFATCEATSSTADVRPPTSSSFLSHALPSRPFNIETGQLPVSPPPNEPASLPNIFSVTTVDSSNKPQMINSHPAPHSLFPYSLNHHPHNEPLSTPTGRSALVVFGGGGERTMDVPGNIRAPFSPSQNNKHNNTNENTNVNPSTFNQNNNVSYMNNNTGSNNNNNILNTSSWNATAPSTLHQKMTTASPSSSKNAEPLSFPFAPLCSSAPTLPYSCHRSHLPAKILPPDDEDEIWDGQTALDSICLSKEDEPATPEAVERDWSKGKCNIIEMINDHHQKSQLLTSGHNSVHNVYINNSNQYTAQNRLSSAGKHETLDGNLLPGGVFVDRAIFEIQQQQQFLSDCVVPARDDQRHSGGHNHNHQNHTNPLTTASENHLQYLQSFNDYNTSTANNFVVIQPLRNNTNPTTNKHTHHHQDEEKEGSKSHHHHNNNNNNNGCPGGFSLRFQI
eukprot:GDKJ01024236.1.p1 GENE.GDKJ01024236.1~~GDKJ01024236.1.p1  ORF type:complete len:1436 (-),score=370.04 GDKJ01024236.1:1531-5838(-)